MQSLLKGIEKLIGESNDDVSLPVKLGALYSSYGYRKYRMSRFEEYSLYSRNMDFLADKNIITFGGADGKLLALRPDVTLSIVKNTKADLDHNEKLYYNETVYRLSGDNLGYSEINQMGVENIGAVDLLTIAEAAELILRSLKLISDDFVLDVSHSGLMHGMVSTLNIDAESKAKVYECIKSKSVHVFNKLMEDLGVDRTSAGRVRRMIELSGSLDEVLGELGSLVVGEEAVDAYVQLSALSQVLGGMQYGDRVRLDLSIVNHLDYYNGIIYNGFIKEYPKAVIVGGQYDKLMEKMGKNAQALGFAFNLDAAPLKRVRPIDVVLLYNDGDDVRTIMQEADKLREKGKNVYVSKNLPQCGYGKVYVFRDGVMEEYL